MTKYQFQVDGRGFDAPMRRRKQDAIQDAVNAGYAHWVDEDTYRINEQASIEVFPD